MYSKKKIQNIGIKKSLLHKLWGLTLWIVVFLLAGAMQFRYHKTQIIAIPKEHLTIKTLTPISEQSKSSDQSRSNNTPLRFYNLTYFDSIILNKKDHLNSHTENEIYLVNLNETDSAALEALPGIGPYLARKIISYRERLGGFISKFQLLEIRNLDSQLIKHPKIEWATNLYPIHKINVRNPDIKILYKHPYIGRDKAKNLIEYIRVRGGLTPENFAEMRSFDAFEKERLYPYLEFQPTN